MKIIWPLILISFASLFVFGISDNIRGPLFPEILKEFNISDSMGSLMFALSSLSENVSIQLYNNLGQLILSQKVVSLNSDLNLENTVNGIYSIRITENGKTVFTSKIVKQ